MVYINISVKYIQLMLEQKNLKQYESDQYAFALLYLQMSLARWYSHRADSQIVMHALNWLATKNILLGS